MKKSKLLLVAVMVFVLSFAISCGGNHTHEYGDWSIVTQPTLTETGVARHVCSCGKVEDIEIPNLANEEVWSVTISQESHLVKGEKVYKSQYGEVVVEIPANPEHTYGEWELTTAPGLNEKGEATRTCACGNQDKKEIPELTDSSFWTVKEEVKADHFKAGYIVYQSKDFGEVTVDFPVVPHEFGNWKIVTEPTVDKVGKAERVCECGEKEEKELPALKDDSFWTVKENVDPTCQKQGHTTYTSEYGEVTVTHDMVDHKYGAWTITVAPTTETEGQAERVCEVAGEKDTAVVPALSDASWKVTEDIKSTYNKAGSKTYTHQTFGDVKVEVAKLPLPFANKEYAIASIMDQYTNSLTYSNGLGTVLNFNNFNGNECFAFVAPDLNKEVVNEIGVHFGVPYEGFHVFFYDDNNVLHYQHYNVKIDVEYYPGTEDSFYPEIMGASYVKDSAGNYVRGKMDVDVVCAYDEANDIITFIDDGNQNMILPEKNLVKGDINGIKVNSKVVLSYTTESGAVINIYFNDKGAQVGVNYADFAGNKISAGEIEAKGNVKVTNANGERIIAFTKVGEKFHETDGVEGTYKNAQDTLTLNGVGSATYNGADGTYTVKDGKVGMFVGGAYYDVTLDGENFTANKPMVEVTFDAGDKATVKAQSYNVNIEYTLPVPENAEFSFNGWFYDNAYTQPVEDPFVAKESVTLYAKWAQKVQINIVGALTEEDKTILLSAGDVIGEHLPKYTVDEVKGMKFVGWFTDEKFANELPLETEITSEDNGFTIYAKWEKLPAYYGNYAGKNVRGSNATYGPETLYFSIDAQNNINGQYVKWVNANKKYVEFTGVVVDYNKETKTITWKETQASTDVYTMYFDETAGVIAYSNNIKDKDLGNDFNVLSKSETSGKNITNKAVKILEKPNTAGSGYRDYFLRVVNIKTAVGDSVLVYFNQLFANYTIEDVEGNAVTTEALGTVNTIIVKADGKVLVAATAENKEAKEKQYTKSLVAPYGKYTTADGKVAIVNGDGTMTFDGKNGTYTKVNETTFDVYLNNNTEYYFMTIAQDVFTMEKVMVTVTFNNGAQQAIEPAQANKNVQFTLPEVKAEGFVFCGWYMDDAFQTPVDEKFIPTADVTVYAKWAKKVTVTVVYNNGTTNTSFDFPENTNAQIEEPVKDGFVFAGWYTTEAFDEGSEWTNGSAVPASITIYAKWAKALPFANKTYGAYRTYVRNEDEKNDAGQTGDILKTDIHGNGWSEGNTFKGITEISFADEATGKLAINVYGFKTHKETQFDPIWEQDVEVDVVDKDENGNPIKDPSKVTTYDAYIDVTTGIIVRYSKGSYNPYEIIVMTPNGKESGRIDISYWNKNSMAIDYNFNGKLYSIYFNGTRVYLNAKLENHSGSAVAANTCYNATDLVIKDAEGKVVYEVGTAPALPVFANKTYKGFSFNVSYANERTPSNAKGKLAFDEKGDCFIAPKLEAGTTDVRAYNVEDGYDGLGIVKVVLPHEGFNEFVLKDAASGLYTWNNYGLKSTVIEVKKRDDYGSLAFGQSDKFTMVDGKFVKDALVKTCDAYVDAKSGVIVYYSSNTYIEVFVPEETNATSANFVTKITSKNNGTITFGEVVITITNGVVTFG